MDNYAWVSELAEKLHEQGQERLAHLIHDIPTQKFEGNHALVEALVPEALAASRSLEIPWLDVYFKHWLCASRIERHQGEVLLSEVVSAYESAHQDKTQGCPQSVCVTQDLVGTYANVDGPGWAQERIAACDETLARIDPSWSCHGCISVERATAMADAGQPREALLYLRSQREEQLRAGEEASSFFVLTELEQCLTLNEPQAALKLLDDSEEKSDEDDESEQMSRQLLRCRALAMAGQIDEAVKLLPDFDEVQVEKYLLWTRAAVALARANPEHDTRVLGRGLWTVIEHLHGVGSHRLLIDCALAQVEFSVARGMTWLADLAVTRAREHVPLLREDLGAGAKVQQAAESLKTAKPVDAPCAHEKLADWLESDESDGVDNERVIQWLGAAHKALPQDEDIAIALGRGLSRFGAHDVARSHLHAMVMAAPDSVSLQNQWFNLCFNAEDLAAIEDQAQRIEGSLPAQAAWYRARVAFKESRFADVGPLVEQVVQHDPEAVSTRSLWADAAMELKDFETARAQRKLVVQAQESPERGARWGWLIAASAAENWAEVRAQAKALEMELDEVPSDDHPVEEDWGVIYLRHDDDGYTHDLLAQRTGPATARILQPSRRTHEQRLGDWVVFEPRQVEQPPEDEEALKHYVRIYPQPLHVLEKGDNGPTYMIDGIHPGEEKLKALRDALEEEGWTTWQYSNEHYRVHDTEAEDTDDEDDESDDDESGLPGLYLAVSAPADVAPRVISAKLAKLCKGMQLCWTDLALDAGEPTAAHEALEERYAL